MLVVSELMFIELLIQPFIIILIFLTLQLYSFLISKLCFSSFDLERNISTLLIFKKTPIFLSDFFLVFLFKISLISPLIFSIDFLLLVWLPFFFFFFVVS